MPDTTEAAAVLSILLSDTTALDVPQSQRVAVFAMLACTMPCSQVPRFLLVHFEWLERLDVRHMNSSHMSTEARRGWLCLL